MIKTIKNLNKPNIKYLVNTNLRDIIVVVQEKQDDFQWTNKMKINFMIVDDYPTNEVMGNYGPVSSTIKEIEKNGETINLISVDDFSLEDMLETVNNKFKEDRVVEEYINSHLKNAKTIEFPDEEKEIDDDDITDVTQLK
jgi:hypothetical protein